jgi:hypothetical protein
MGQLTQTTTELQAIVDNSDAANVGKTSLTDGSDTTAVAFKKSGFYSLQGSSSNAPSTDRAVLISAIRDTAATGEIRYGQIAITESNGLWWNRDDGGSLGTWYAAVSTTGTQTLTNKTLTSPVLTTPQINDSAADHQYIFAGSNLVADRTITLPLLTGDDTFVFEAHTQTLTNKTLTSPVFNTGVSGTAVLDADDFTGASATTLATSESIKAYVDSQVGSFDTLSEVLAAGNTTGSTDIEVTAAQKVQFRDAAIYINSSVDGQLDIVADTEIQIAATTVDLNGNLDVSGTALVTGVLTTTAATVFNGGFASNADSTLGTDKKVQFRDSAIYINSSADGQLDIVADTEIQIAATTIDVNGTLAFDSLKGTGATTVTNILDEDNMASDSATAIATQQSIKAYVDSQVGSFDTLAEVLAQGNTTGGTDLAVSAGDDITFTDTSKAIFGAGSDLQIYHDGTYNWIKAASSQFIFMQADEMRLRSATGETYFTATLDGSTGLYYDSVVKLATTATGIDVTGTVTADGLTVEGSSTGTLSVVNFLNTDTSANATANRLGLGISNSAGTNYTYIEAKETGVDAYAEMNFYTGSTTRKRLTLGTDGDISFYEDTGTTPKLFWDASAESLGIGTGSPDGELHVLGAAGGNGDVYVERTSGAKIHTQAQSATGIFGTASNHDLAFKTNDTQRMRIDASGNVGINVISPADTFGGSGTLDAAGPLLSRGQIGQHQTNAGVLQYGSNVTTIRSYGATSGSGIIAFNTGGGGAADTERMRIDSSGHAIIPAGVTLGTAAGVYAAANTLDDYEEGTWTPTGTNISAANGTYTKIGNQVTVFGYAYWNGAGEMSIGGLPFTCVKSGEGAVSYKNVDLTAGTIQITGSADVSGTTFTGFNSFDNGARAPNTVTKDTSELWFSVTYSV